MVTIKDMPETFTKQSGSGLGVCKQRKRHANVTERTTRFNVIGTEKGTMIHEHQREHCFFGVLDSLRRRD
jgi:hypothetical protein